MREVKNLSCLSRKGFVTVISIGVSRPGHIVHVSEMTSHLITLRLSRHAWLTVYHNLLDLNFLCKLFIIPSLSLKY